MWLLWLLACSRESDVGCVDAVVTDIDETLTLLDSEFLEQLNDPSYDPQERPDASTLMHGYADLGFTVVYVSTRGQDQPMADGTTASEATDAWLTDHGFPRSEQDVFLAPGRAFAGGTRGISHKASVVGGLEDWGWRFAHAYGNGVSDVEAFRRGGVRDRDIFHVGRLAGTIPGVTPLSDDEAYTAHLTHLAGVERSCP